MTLVQQHPQTGAVAAVAAPLPSRFRHPVAYRQAIRRERAQLRHDQELAWRVQDVLAALGLYQKGSSIAAGPTFYIPRVVAVHRGSPIRLTIQTLPGQVPDDFAQRAVALAQNLGVARVRVQDCGPGLIQLDLLETDPLLESIPLPRRALGGVQDLVLLGVDDAATRYRISPFDLVHLAVQGATGSGKSVFTYGLLSQLVTAPDLLIAISDPTGLLTRPFVGTIHAPWQVAGTEDPDAHVRWLQRLVEEMDRRNATLPPRRDQVAIGPDCPLIVAVLEEYPGLLRNADDGKRSGGRVERIKRLIARLISEGRKAGIRLVILAQRFEAAVVGGFERDQCTVKLTFRVGYPASVEMLHPLATRDDCLAHATCEPGIALLTGPGVPLARIRSPFIGHGQHDDDTAYARYWDHIAAHAARLTDSAP
jgi:hypothetical protein